MLQPSVFRKTDAAIWLQNNSNFYIHETSLKIQPLKMQNMSASGGGSPTGSLPLYPAQRLASPDPINCYGIWGMQVFVRGTEAEPR